MTPAALTRRNRVRIIVAFAAVYVVWGSTYLFIKYAVDAIPPFLLGFIRFALSGGILYLAARLRGASKPTSYEWKMAAISGVLMLGVGNGAVIWSVQTLPSGITALIVSSVPIWIVVIDWLRGKRPRQAVLIGVALGFVGMAILIGPRAFVGQGSLDAVATGILLAGSIGWAAGTLVTRGSTRPGSPLVFSALQMLAASGAMLIMAVVMGEPASFSVRSITPRAAWSIVFLVFAGSIVGFTAYVYLLGVVSAAKAATYAYVNPVIAVLLGWLFLDEPIGMRTLVAAAVILGGVAIITSTQSAGSPVTGEHPLPTPKQPERSAA
jgi:drug/metabolite transporter (DMT)-like permease